MVSNLEINVPNRKMALNEEINSDVLAVLENENLQAPSIVILGELASFSGAQVEVALNKDCKVITVSKETLNISKQSKQIENSATTIATKLLDMGVRWTTLVGLGEGSSVAIALAVNYPSQIRRLVLVDPLWRISPSISSRLIDRIERYLPVGLPLRNLSSEFDARPLLHRLRCPTIVISTQNSSIADRTEAKLIAAKAPNARHVIFVGSEPIATELTANIVNFLKSPVKRSQK